MKQAVKRALALVLSLSLTLGLLTAGASAASYPDMPQGWSKAAMESAVENGLLQGSSAGRLDPKGLLTRAQMAAILTRAFGAEKAADLSGFSDVRAGTWYYSYLAKAVYMGAFTGTGNGKLYPDEPITRQEVFVVLARALKLPDGSEESLAGFADASRVSAWAVGPTAAMVEAGYVAGSGGSLLPKENITREQFAQIMYNIFGTYLNEAGTYTSVERSVMVNVPDVIIKDAVVNGDVVIGDGVGDGDVTLDHVTITGRLVIRGGGVNSVHIINSHADEVIVSKVDGGVRVVADGDSAVEVVIVADGNDDVIIEGIVGKLVVDADAPVVARDAQIGTVEVTAAQASVSLTGETTVDKVVVTESAEGSTVVTDESAAIGTVEAEVDVTVTGEGTVGAVEGSGNVTDSEGKPVGEPEEPAQPVQPPVHTHSYKEADRVEPTCTEDGTVTYVCSCGASKTGTIPALGHSWDEGVVTVEPTCTEDGEKVHTCTVDGCGATQTEIIPALGHTVVTDPAVEPTCSETGLTEGSHCSVCGEVLVAQEIVDALGHTVVTDPAVAPTCTESGLTEGSHCSVCGEIIVAQEVVNALGHTVVTDPAVAPTCTETGLTEGSHCSVCGEVIVAQEVVDALGHSWDEGVVTSEPTCTEDGKKVFSCTMEGCGATKAEAIPALGHTAVIDPAVSPTCTETGLTKGSHCSVCGEVIVAQEVVPALGHTVATDPAVSPTCTESGLTEGSHCSVCGEILVAQKEIAATGHTYAEEWSYDDTWHWHTAICQHTEEESGRAEHTWDDGVITKQPTKTEDGEELHTCTVCGAVKSVTLPATGEVVVPEPTGFSLTKEFNECLITVSVEMDEEEVANFSSYYIDYCLSADGGNTWTPSIGSFMPQEGEDGLTTFLSFETLDAGTYTKLKLVSTVCSNGEWKIAETVFDCNIVVTVEQSFATATLHGSAGNYLTEISGLTSTGNYNSGYMIWFSSTASFDNRFGISGNSGMIPGSDGRAFYFTSASMTSESYYCIAEYDYDNLTAEGTSASITFKRTDWAKCCIDPEPINYSVSDLRFTSTDSVPHDGAYLTWNAPDDAPYEARYKVFASQDDGVTWQEVGTAWIETEVLLNLHEAGNYNTFKVVTYLEGKSIGEYVSTDLALTVAKQAGTAAEVSLEFDASKKLYLMSVSGLTPWGKYEIVMVDNPDNPVFASSLSTRVDKDGCMLYPITQYAANKLGSNACYLIYEYSDYAANEGGTVCSFTITQLGDWTKCNFTFLTYPVSNLRFTSADEPFLDGAHLAWDAPADAPDGVFYEISVSQDGGATWQWAGASIGTEAELKLHEAGTYNAFRVVTYSSGVNIGECISTELTLTVSKQAGAAAGVSLEFDASEEVYLMSISGLTPWITCELSSVDDPDNPGFISSLYGNAGSDGCMRMLLGQDFVDGLADSPYYLVYTYSDYAASEDGKTCSFTVTQLGDWTEWAIPTAE